MIDKYHVTVARAEPGSTPGWAENTLWGDKVLRKFNKKDKAFKFAANLVVETPWRKK